MSATAIQRLVDRYTEHLASVVRPGTLRQQQRHLARFTEWLDTRGVFDACVVTPQHIEKYRAHLLDVEYRSRAGMKRLGRRTRYDALAAVQRFFAWLVARRLLVADPAVAVKRGDRGSWQPANVLTEAEIVMLLDAPDARTPIGIRDRAVLELLYSTGLRRAEVAALDLQDVDLAEGLVVVRCGKGGKQRVVPLGCTAVDAIINYLTTARPLFLRNPAMKALFLVSSLCGQRGRRLGGNSIPLVIQRAARLAGLDQRITPHTFRHSVATHLLRAGGGLRHVQELLGHNRIDTTETYTHLDATDLAAAHAKAHPRGRKKR